MIEQSESTKDIAAALVKFHDRLPKIPKNKTGNIPMKNGGSYSYKYADLSDIQEIVNPILVANGLTYVQFPSGEYGLATQLMHVSGEWIRAHYTMRPASDTAQAQGSAITYQKRYALGAVLGLDIDGDDDGNAASASHNAPQRPTTAPNAQEAPRQQPAQQSRTYEDSAKVPEGTHTLKVISQKGAKTKSTGKDFTIVKTDKGEVVNFGKALMLDGRTYHANVGKFGIESAQEVSTAQQILTSEEDFGDAASYME